MSRSSTATLNHQLTAFAQGHMNDLSRTMELAERLCPTVGVPGSSGQYKQFDDNNSFLVYETGRALGGDPNRVHFDADDAFYNCKPQALEVTIDEDERKQAGDGALAQQLLDEGKIKALLNAKALSSAKKRVDFVIANTTPLAGGIGEWSNPDIDPIDQLDQVVDDLAQVCGDGAGIKITMDLTAFRTIRNHPKSKARCNGVQAIPLSMQQITDALTLPVEIKAFAISYNTKAKGVAPAKARLLNGNVLVHYSVPNPTVFDPSAFKCFVVGSNNVLGVRSYMAGHGLYGGHVVDWTEDLKKTSSQAVKRIALT